MTTVTTATTLSSELNGVLIDVPQTSDEFETTALLPRKIQKIKNTTSWIRRLFLYLERTIRITFVF